VIGRLLGHTQPVATARDAHLADDPLREATEKTGGPVAAALSGYFEVEDRAVPGHWEGDLLLDSNNTHIATLVERRSRFTLLVKVENREAQTVVRALTRNVRRLPTELSKSLTWDRGGEMAAHKKFSVATDVRVYFCDPRSPWQRGTNENTNRLLRQYFPKGTDLSGFTQVDRNRIALRLNQRPRKTLNFRSPADVFDETVALTG
jgi:IS30 family transposase